jgi:hypothetical protein
MGLPQYLHRRVASLKTNAMTRAEENLPIDLDRLRATPVSQDPFAHMIVPGFLPPAACAAINDDYPTINKGGSIPLSAVHPGPAFNRMIEALRSPAMTAAVSEKFDIDLEGRPTMVTVRARARMKDGQIHTDSKGKLITALLYMNSGWESDGGRLRLLRSPTSLDDYAAEVPPDEGTLLLFKCTDDAWHGHKPFEGARRAIQLNWVVDDGYLKREQRRHGLSAFLKKLPGFS